MIKGLNHEYDANDAMNIPKLNGNKWKRRVVYGEQLKELRTQ